MNENNIQSLCKKFEQYFKVGAAITTQLEPKEEEILKYHFNEIVAENCTKMMYVYPDKDTFFWDDADKFIECGEKNNMKIRWHNFVWHNQAAPWIYFDDFNPMNLWRNAPNTIKFDREKFDPMKIFEENKLATKEQMEQRLKKYIQEVCNRYRGKIASYDVVNEVISDKKFSLRTKDDHSMWQEIMGSDYVEKAFYWAHEADPNAELVINDYNLETIVEKRDAEYEFIRNLKNKGVPITTVGLQMHVNMISNEISMIEEAIEKFASLGTNVILTEMDVSIYKFEDTQKKEITQDLLLKQADYYEKLFECFVRQAKKGNLTDVVLWGISDKKSWKNDFPVPGRGDIPLLFDKDYEPKDALRSILNINL